VIACGHQSTDNPVNQPPRPATDDDRRELLRIDDRLLLEYWLEGKSGPSVPQTVLELFLSPPARADRLTPAKRTACASQPVTPAA
jgi:hypothetical protein